MERRTLSAAPVSLLQLPVGLLLLICENLDHNCRAGLFSSCNWLQQFEFSHARHFLASLDVFVDQASHTSSLSKWLHRRRHLIQRLVLQPKPPSPHSSSTCARYSLIHAHRPQLACLESHKQGMVDQVVVAACALAGGSLTSLHVHAPGSNVEAGSWVLGLAHLRELHVACAKVHLAHSLNGHTALKTLALTLTPARPNRAVSDGSLAATTHVIVHSGSLRKHTGTVHGGTPSPPDPSQRGAPPPSVPQGSAGSDGEGGGAAAAAAVSDIIDFAAWEGPGAADAEEIIDVIDLIDDGDDVVAPAAEGGHVGSGPPDPLIRFDPGCLPPSLTCISLSGAQSLPAAMIRATQLRELKVQRPETHTPFNHFGLDRLSRLTSLALGEGLRRLPPQLAGLRALRALSLEGNALYEEGTAQLAALNACTALRELYLANSLAACDDNPLPPLHLPFPHLQVLTFSSLPPMAAFPSGLPLPSLVLLALDLDLALASLPAHLPSMTALTSLYLTHTRHPQRVFVEEAQQHLAIPSRKWIVETAAALPQFWSVLSAAVWVREVHVGRGLLQTLMPQLWRDPGAALRWWEEALVGKKVGMVVWEKGLGRFGARDCAGDGSNTGGLHHVVLPGMRRKAELV